MNIRKVWRLCCVSVASLFWASCGSDSTTQATAPEINDPVKLGHDDAVKLLKLIDKFEDHDDVQDVYHNAEIDEADMDAE